MYGLSNGMNTSDLESHFCCYDWQSMSRGPSASAELLVQNSDMTSTYATYVNNNFPDLCWHTSEVKGLNMKKRQR